MNKQKRVNKSREQIIFEKEQKKLAEQRKEFIDKTFMPVMDGLCQNLEEAQFLCESTKTAINQAWQNRAGELPLSWLMLKEPLQKVKRPELVAKHIKVIETLEGQTIKDAMILLDSLFDEVQRAVMFSMKNKKISEFQNAGPDNPGK